MQPRISSLACIFGTVCHLVGWSSCTLSLAADPQVWYLRAGADGDGTSVDKPFGTAEMLEDRTHDGDVILLIASDPPLRHGVTLKKGQTLIGISQRDQKATITCVDAARNGGHGVVLASNVRVSNIRIVDTFASGIYGNDVTNTLVDAVEIERANCSESMTDVMIEGVGPLPHGGIVIHCSQKDDSKRHRIVRSKVIDANGVGVGVISSNGASSRMELHESRVEGGAPVGIIDVGIGAVATGTSSEANVEVFDTSVQGRLSPGGRNVIAWASSRAKATANLRRCHVGRVGQDGVIAVAGPVAADVRIDIADSVVEQAGQLNIEGTILNFPAWDTAETQESRIWLNITDSTIRNAGATPGFTKEQLAGGNIWVGASPIAQQIAPNSQTPLPHGNYVVSIVRSHLEDAKHFAIGVGGTKQMRGEIDQETSRFELKVRESIIRGAGASTVIVTVANAHIDARQNFWAPGNESNTGNRVLLLESGESSKVDVSDPLSSTPAFHPTRE